MKNCDVDMNIKLHLKSLLNKVEKSIFGILKKYDTHPDIKDKLDRIVLYFIVKLDWGSSGVNFKCRITLKK